MNMKKQIREKALELGYLDAGFIGVDPLDLYIKEIESRPEMYNWIMTDTFNTKRGATLSEKQPWAKSVLVLVESYFTRNFPHRLVGTVGRCYQVDERKERGEGYKRIVELLKFISNSGVRLEFDRGTPIDLQRAPG